MDIMLGLEIELEFIPLYENQPLFSDVETFVRDNQHVLKFFS